MSIKAYKYRIEANKATTEKLQWVLDRARELYNAGLQERRDVYEIMVKRHPNYYDEATRKQLTREHAISVYEQKRDLVDIKEEIRPEYQEVASHVLQDVLFRLDKAFKAFFRRIKNGEKPGYPRFQGRNRYDSFCYPDRAGWKLTVEEREEKSKKKFSGRLHLSKIGTVKVKLHREMEGNVKTLTVKREGCLLLMKMSALIWVSPTLLLSPMGNSLTIPTISDVLKRSWHQPSKRSHARKRGAIAGQRR